MTGEIDCRLTVLERHAISTEKRLDGVDKKLDQIVAAVTRRSRLQLAVIDTKMEIMCKRLGSAESLMRRRPEIPIHVINSRFASYRELNKDFSLLDFFRYNPT